ncbi:hypothetical protein TIFTF001_002602 [Ficus carica]|uniref:Uncharacterized protein n=1 Tax=Ficus carica TaxID=3494 RepID=A0AA87Z771_FICCA|nr:hypothetical protein TIFTF001_002602 [Ficus carica]
MVGGGDLARTIGGRSASLDLGGREARESRGPGGEGLANTGGGDSATEKTTWGLRELGGGGCDGEEGGRGGSQNSIVARGVRNLDRGTQGGGAEPRSHASKGRGRTQIAASTVGLQPRSCEGERDGTRGKEGEREGGKEMISDSGIGVRSGGWGWDR